MEEKKNNGKTVTSFFITHITMAIIGILICAFFLVVSAYAYFTHDLASSGNRVVSVSYELTVTGTNTAEPIPLQTSYACVPGEEGITFTLTANGSASTGYCKIVIADQTRFTTQIPQGQSISFTVKAETDAEITMIFQPSWGTSALYASNATDELITDGEIIDLRS